MLFGLFKRRSAKFQIALGLTGLLTTILMAAVFVGFVADEGKLKREGRIALAETIAVNSSVFITRADIQRMGANLRLIIKRNDELLSAAVRPTDRKPVLVVGDHLAHWQPLVGGRSTDSQLSVPIWEDDHRWGSVELRFKPLVRAGWRGLFDRPLLGLFGFVLLFSFIAFYLYLGKMLKHLDPGKAIPDRVRSALDTMAEGLLVLDAKQNIVLANQAFSELVAQTPDKLLGQNVARFGWENADEEDFDPADSPWGDALAQGTAQMGKVIRLRTQAADLRSFMTNCSPVMGGGGKVAGVLISFDDVTELEKKELELRQSQAEAETANRAKSEFLANMSHEIRTPMNAILGFTEVLKRGHGTNREDSAKYLNTIASSGQHLLGLINDILDLSKVEAGAIEVEKIPLAIHHIIGDVVDIMQVKAQEKGIYLEFRPDGPLPEQIHSDPARLRQILTNLIGNAIKFTDQGGVTLVTRLSRQGADPLLIIDVVDTGIGMSQEQADAVFNPFVQADSSITRRFGGTGLGLTISKRFAELLGGGIKVHSEAGKGSTFSIEIKTGALGDVKFLNPQELLSSRQAEAEADTVDWQFPAARVLVVDDGDENRNLLEVVLGDVGLQVDTAVNGKDGSDKVLAGAYDLVLMDIQMPIMDGYEAVALLRDRGVKIPVIALTAHAMTGIEKQCLEAGYSGYMTKPINIDDLLKRLAQLLGGKAVAAASAEAQLMATDRASVKASDTANALNALSEPVAQLDAARTVAADEGPLRSSLPMTNPKMRSIVERFSVRLREQLDAIEDAWQTRDFKALAELAHWLKGSAGSVGFHQFTPLAKELEALAMAETEPGIADIIQQLNSLFDRIELDAQQAPAETDVAPVEQKVYPMPPVVRSRLPVEKEKFRKIVEAFVIRLDSQVIAIRSAADRKEYQELADLAHWLKGSAGSVGFDVFYEPARDLEEYSQQRNDELLEQAVCAIDELNSRITLDN